MVVLHIGPLQIQFAIVRHEPLPIELRRELADRLPPDPVALYEEQRERAQRAANGLFGR